MGEGGVWQVWLGSVKTDGIRLVSDGADNKSTPPPLARVAVPGTLS